MGLTKPIEQIVIKLSRYIYVSKKYYTRGYEHGIFNNNRDVGEMGNYI